MCHAGMMISGHLYLLTWQVICAVPTIVLFSTSDSMLAKTGYSSVSAHPGIAFFAFVCVVSFFGFWLVVLRECCGCCFLLRWVEDALLVVYVLAELAICGWSISFAYFFCSTLSNQGTNVSDAWFWLGAVGSVVLAVFALLVICSAWAIMRDGHAKREAQKERSSERERQPLMGNNNQGIVYA